MATLDQARKRIVLDASDYEVLDELVQAGVRSGLIGSTPAKRVAMKSLALRAPASSRRRRAS